VRYKVTHMSDKVPKAEKEHATPHLSMESLRKLSTSVSLDFQKKPPADFGLNYW